MVTKGYKWVPLGRTGMALQKTTTDLSEKRKTLRAILFELDRKLDYTRTRVIDPDAGAAGIRHAISMLQDLLTAAADQAKRL